MSRIDAPRASLPLHERVAQELARSGGAEPTCGAWPERIATDLVLRRCEVGSLLTAATGAAALAELLAQDIDERQYNELVEDGDKVPVLTPSQVDGLALALVALTGQIKSAMLDHASEMHSAIRRAKGVDTTEAAR